MAQKIRNARPTAVTLEKGPRFGCEDAAQPAVAPRGAYDAQGRPVTAGCQSAGVAMSQNGAIVWNQFCTKSAYPVVGFLILILYPLGLRDEISSPRYA